MEASQHGADSTGLEDLTAKPFAQQTKQHIAPQPRSNVQDTHVLFEQARALHRDKQWIEAAKVYESILAIEPDHHEVLHLLGLLSHQAGDSQLAIELLHQAISIDGTQAAYYVNFGSALQALDHTEVALDAYDVAIALDPTSFQAFNNRAHIRLKQGEKALAAADLQAAIALDPNYIEGYFTLAACFEDLGDDQKAIGIYNAVIEKARRLRHGQSSKGTTNLQPKLASGSDLQPHLADTTDQSPSPALPDHHDMALAATINLALCLSRLGKADEALSAIEAAIQLSPDHPLANTTLAHCLRDLQRHDEALAAYHKACDLNQSSAESLVHLGMAYRECFDLDTAIHYYDQALSKRPGWQEANWNKSMALLLRGDYREGFRLYETRWQRPEFRNIRAASEKLISKPLLRAMQEAGINGLQLASLIKDKSILIFAEQGFGDTLQFCRFAILIKALGAKVFLHVPAILERLCKEIDPFIEVSSAAHSIESLQHTVDFHIPMMSLPLALDLDLEAISRGPCGYLKSSSLQREHWAKALNEAHELKAPERSVSPRARVGIMWRGSQAYVRNFRRRSVVLERFIEAFADLPIELISLQVDPSLDEQQALRAAGVISLHESVQDFADTAALVQHLDAVVTVDTSVAHLCGGIGVPTWVLVPYRADWRWMLKRDDSPWYPSVRLLRRPINDDGSYVLAQAREALSALNP